MKALKKQIKVNKYLVITLTLVSFLLAILNIHQTIAGNNSGSTIKQNNNHYVSILQTYSDEIEFTSAPEYSENIIKMKGKYKIKFLNILGDRLNSVSNDKLELISKKIENKIEEIKYSEIMQFEKKEKILSQLLALLDIIQTEIEDTNEYSVDIDLNKLLEI